MGGARVAALAMLALGGAVSGLAVGSAAANEPEAVRTAVIRASLAQPAVDLLSPLVLRQLNEERERAGQPPVQRHGAMDAQAQAWAQAMAANGTLAHQANLALVGTQALGNSWTLLGENVGTARTVNDVMAAFRASPGHHRNTVGPFSLVGIGTAFDRNGRLWVAIQFAATGRPPSHGRPVYIASVR